MYAAKTPTPAGDFWTIVDDDNVVHASGWAADLEEIIGRINGGPTAPVNERRDLGAVTKAINSYLKGELEAVDNVTVKQRGGAFIEAAWDQLRTVPAGTTVTYRELAIKTGRPDAVRAAASACARNAAALFVPCHRVVRTGGGLGGFRWGLDVKRWLLDHERQ